MIITEATKDDWWVFITGSLFIYYNDL